MGPILTTRLQQKAEHGLRQLEQLEHRRDPCPADPKSPGDLGLAVHHTAIEEPPELEGPLDGALQAALGFLGKCSARGNQGLQKREDEPADRVLPIVGLGEPIKGSGANCAALG